MNTLRDIDQHIHFLKIREYKLSTDQQYNCPFERQICKHKIMDFEKSKELYLAFQDCLYNIVNKDAQIYKLINDIWDDIEPMCPWGNRQQLKLQRLKQNISTAKSYKEFTHSDFYYLIKIQFDL